MKVLMVNGSSKKDGNTAYALHVIANVLKEQGIESEIIQIGNKQVRGCIGCGACSGKGKCAFDDDVANEIIEKMENSDGLIIGSPVYFASPNGALLALLDRVFYAGNVFAHKPAASIAVARRAGTTSTLDAINKYFTIRQMPVVSSRYWNVAFGQKPSEVVEDKEGIQIMEILGNNMAWLLKTIEAGKAAGIEAPALPELAHTNYIR